MPKINYLKVVYKYLLIIFLLTLRLNNYKFLNHSFNIFR